jgi:hypothetical protein
MKAGYSPKLLELWGYWTVKDDTQKEMLEKLMSPEEVLGLHKVEIEIKLRLKPSYSGYVVYDDYAGNIRVKEVTK